MSAPCRSRSPPAPSAKALATAKRPATAAAGSHAAADPSVRCFSRRTGRNPPLRTRASPPPARRSTCPPGHSCPIRLTGTSNRRISSSSLRARYRLQETVHLAEHPFRIIQHDEVVSLIGHLNFHAL